MKRRLRKVVSLHLLFGMGVTVNVVIFWEVIKSFEGGCVILN